MNGANARLASTIRSLLIASSSALILAGCLGGSSGGDSSSDDEQDVELSRVTSENSGDLARSGSGSISGASEGTDSLTAFNNALSSIDTSSTQSLASQTLEPASTHPPCDEGSVSVSQDGDTVSYETDGCSLDLDAGETILEGAYVLSSGEWSDSPCGGSSAFEMIFGGDPQFKATGGVNFLLEGAFGYRSDFVFPDGYPNSFAGEYCYAFEYGSTEDGLSIESDSGNVSMQPNAFFGITTEFSVDSGGNLSGFTQQVTSDGVFELADGEFYEVSFNNVSATDEGSLDNSTWGDEEQYQLPSEGFCPDSGEMTISGADGTSATVLFGDSADADGRNDAVQVQGPDNTFEYYETCDDFYNDNPV